MATKGVFPSIFVFVTQLLLIVLGILTLLFFMQRLSGDPAAILAGHNASPEVLEVIREDMGLNKPLYVQYGVFLGKTMQLDFGESMRYQQPALDMVLSRFPNTLILSACAILMAMAIGIPLGIYAAVFRHRADGIIVNLLSGVLQSLPSFWLGLVLLLIFSVKLQWFGSVSSLEENFFQRMALPTITLSTFYVARLIRLVRSGLIEESTQYYVLTARAKGLSGSRVLMGHMFKNSLIPIVAFITLDLSFLIGGSVIVESLFSYNGMGDQMVKAIFNRDYAIVQASVFVVAILVVVVNSFSNFLYRVIDPRIEY